MQLNDEDSWRKSGSAQPFIKPRDIKSRLVALPPLDEQRRIVEVLERAAGIRRLREQALEKARALIPALFLDMFGDPATNPKGWEIRRVGEVAKIKGGKRLPKASQYSENATTHRYIRAGDIWRGYVSIESVKFISNELHEPISRYVVAAGDCVITIAGKIGVAAPIDEDLDGSNLTENAARLSPRADPFSADYLAAALNHSWVQSQIDALTGQVTISKLSLERLSRLSFQFPPLKIQYSFAERVAEIRGIIARQEQSLDAARALERALMARLLG